MKIKTVIAAVFLLVSGYCSAVITITGDSFQYTDDSGKSRNVRVHGYTEPLHIQPYLLRSESRTSKEIPISSIHERMIADVIRIQFQCYEDASPAQSELDLRYNNAYAFIVFLDDGTQIVVLDFLTSEQSAWCESKTLFEPTLSGNKPLLNALSSSSVMAVSNDWSAAEKAGASTPRKQVTRTLRLSMKQKIKKERGNGRLTVPSFGRTKYIVVERASSSSQ